MEEQFKNVFIETLSMTKNEEIDKTDILRVGEEYGLAIPARTSKANVIAKIVEEGYFNRLYEAFSEFIYIPVWSVADYFSINSDDVLQLGKLGIIKEAPLEKEFYSRRSRKYYKANTYNIRILENYTSEELKEKLKIANSGNGYKIRFETNTREEIQPFIDELSKVFKLSDHRVYERRNTGFNTYIDVKILNNSELEKNVLLQEIQSLRKALKDQEDRLTNSNKKNMEYMRRRINIKDTRIQELKKELELTRNSEMKFITLQELKELEISDDVEKIKHKGKSAIDGNSLWSIIYYKDGTEEDVYVK